MKHANVIFVVVAIVYLLTNIFTFMNEDESSTVVRCNRVLGTCERMDVKI